MRAFVITGPGEAGVQEVPEPRAAVIWEAFKPESEPRRPSRRSAQPTATPTAAPTRRAAQPQESDFLQRQGGIY